MSKPLKLTIHPRLGDTNLSAHDIHQGRLTTLRLAQAKRLTDAELAAEWWRACLTVHQLDHAFDSSSRALTLHRFATSPHYFEADQ